MTKPTRIAPAEDGSELNPPSGGTWIRDADGGLSPKDRDTAHGAGLRWADDPEEVPQAPLYVDPVQDAAPAADTETPQE